MLYLSEFWFSIWVGYVLFEDVGVVYGEVMCYI